MNKVAVGIAIGSVALLGLTGVAANISQMNATTPAPNVSVSASPKPTRESTTPTRVATPNYVAPTAIPTTPAPLARTDESAPVVDAPVAPVAVAPVTVPKSASAAVVAPAPVVAPVAPAPVPTVVPTTKVTTPPLGAGSGVDCAHLKPGDAFAGISQVCHLDPNDPLYTGPKPVTTPAPCATHTPDVTCQAIGCPVLPNK